MAAFYLELPFPISANTYYTSSGPWITKSGREWRKAIISDVWQQLHGLKPEALIGPVAVRQMLWIPEKRQRRIDLDNYTGKHVWDALTKAGIWCDDSQVWRDERIRMGKSAKGQLIIETWEI